MNTTRFSAIAVSLLSLSAVACVNTIDDPGTNGSSASSATSSTTTTVDRTDREATAAAILDAFASEDWDALAELSSDAGVRFTPYTYANPDTDVPLTQNEIATFDTDNTVKMWGTQEGSGDPIAMTKMQYFERYVWDHDYRNADETRWNEVQDHGSMIDNAKDVYPTAEIVEYHFDGFDEQYGGMDWRSLRLVLEKDDDGNYALVGVIHDEWTP